mgnify:CR=1 FL=1
MKKLSNISIKSEKVVSFLKEAIAHKNKLEDEVRAKLAERKKLRKA